MFRYTGCDILILVSDAASADVDKDVDDDTITRIRDEGKQEEEQVNYSDGGWRKMTILIMKEKDRRWQDNSKCTHDIVMVEYVGVSAVRADDVLKWGH